MLQARNSFTSFYSERKFYDYVTFPYGIDRSGEFTIQQAEALEKHGRAYIALASGERLPMTEEEDNFVLFCRGGKTAKSLHELTWKRYREACGRASQYNSVSLSHQFEHKDDFPIDTD